MHVNDAGMGGITGNPGFQAQATPVHGYPQQPAGGPTYSDAGVLYPGPAAIPPTQPGYTNFAPGNAAAQPAPYPQAAPVYPPLAAPAYPPQASAYSPQAAPYPPQASAYPPQAAPYPPQAAPYPPAAGLPYPAQPGGQPAYNPTAPP
jgi:hypothetical protein